MSASAALSVPTLHVNATTASMEAPTLGDSPEIIPICLFSNDLKRLLDLSAVAIGNIPILSVTDLLLDSLGGALSTGGNVCKIYH